ncbi:MAG: hypothetical protein HOP16_00180 [Acidobacteria bacterium]|nr:hypothetical protein [Acidobacteriota bacterium]
MTRGAVMVSETFEAEDMRAPGSGRAVVPSTPGTPGKTYVCNAENHCIDVFDDSGERLFTFGEFGSDRGQLNEPTDIVAVCLQGSGRPSGATTPSGEVLVVADRGNHRLQLFSLEGRSLATIDPWLGRSRRVDLNDRSGWPFFRVNPLPQMVLPTTLEWRAPFLSVAGGDGRVVALDLELSLLPDFQTWLNTTPSDVVRRALDDSLRHPTRDAVPDADLWAVDGHARSSIRLVRNSWA